MAVYDINGNVLAEMNQSNAKTYSLTDGSLIKVDGNAVSYAGYGPAIAKTQAATRRVFAVTKGEMPYVDAADGSKLDGVYPIPIPDDCTVATVTITPSTQSIYVSTRSFKDGKYSNTAVNVTGWQTGTASIDVVRKNGERMFLTLSSIYDGQEPTNVEITFLKTDIISLNPNVKEMLLQAKRPKNLLKEAYLTNVQPLMLLWFSDIHGEQRRLSRIVEFKQKFSDILDDAVCTGDMVRLRYSDGMSWWYNTPGADEILTVMGNHDVLGASSGYDVSIPANLKSQADLYNTFFAPNLSKWGIVVEQNKTYYYKDYTSKKIRIIALNVCLLNDEELGQREWFRNVLDDALTKELSVIVMIHYIVPHRVKISCTFSPLDNGLGGYDPTFPIEYTTIVDTFMQAGGEFICYLGGHMHHDSFTYCEDYPNQRCIVLDAAGVDFGNWYSDTQRTINTKSEDLFNVMSFDTDSKVVKLIRVGANMDHYVRQKNVLTFRYDTGEILANY